MSEIPPAERAFLVGAERRLGLIILCLVPVGTAAVAWQWGRAEAVAFAVGGAVAYANYRWIVAVVDALVRAQRATVPRRVYLKLFLPLVLLAAVLYVIFSRSLLSVAGFLGGVFLLVAGVLVEAVYEVFLALRR